MMGIRYLILALMFSVGIVSGAQAQSSGTATHSVGKEIKASSASTEGKTDEANKKLTDEDEAKAAEDSVAAEDPLNYTRPEYSYSPEGRRDPFVSLVPEQNKDEKKIKGLFNYEKATLRGIVNTDGDIYAMVVDADNYAYVLRENDAVFGGYVTKITDNTLQLHIVKYGRAMTIILRMETAKKTLMAQEQDGAVVRKPGITVAWGEGNESGVGMTIGDVSVPTLETRTIEDSWFGNRKRGTDRGVNSSPYLLLTPVDNTEVNLPIVLRWTKSPQDSLYTIVIAGDRDFSTPIFVKEGIKGSSFLLDANPSTESRGPLYWKMIVMQKSGETYTSRNILSFRIK
jgi:hypothetical protein